MDIKLNLQTGLYGQILINKFHDNMQIINSILYLADISGIFLGHLMGDLQDLVGILFQLIRLIYKTAAIYGLTIIIYSSDLYYIIIIAISSRTIKLKQEINHMNKG